MMKLKFVTSNEILGGRFVVLVKEERTGSTGDKRKMHYAVLNVDLKPVYAGTSKVLLEAKVQELMNQHQSEVQAEDEAEREQQELEVAE